MKVLLEDIGLQLKEDFKDKFDTIIYADGQYEHCIGCFRCWTDHPQVCQFEDTLQEVSVDIGDAEELWIVTKNRYGCYCHEIKTILDRSVGASSPLMSISFNNAHNISRHKTPHRLFKVMSYGDATDIEKETFDAVAKRNCKNYGYAIYEYDHYDSIEQLLEELQ